MAYTQVKIKQEYRDKLAKLAALHNRSMANMIEVLIVERARQDQIAIPESKRDLLGPVIDRMPQSV